jgi:hypothetical protein
MIDRKRIMCGEKAAIELDRMEEEAESGFMLKCN